MQSWQDALKECEKTLEKGDRERALGVKSIQNFRDELETLQDKYSDEQSVRAINPLTCTTRWLEEIGHKLQILNGCKESISDFSKVRRDTVKVNREIVILWLSIIMTFRNEGYGREGQLRSYKIILH